MRLYKLVVVMVIDIWMLITTTKLQRYFLFGIILGILIDEMIEAIEMRAASKRFDIIIKNMPKEWKVSKNESEDTREEYKGEDR